MSIFAKQLKTIIMKKLFRRLFRIVPVGTVVQLSDDTDAWGDIAGSRLVVTGYCKFFHRIGYRLDGNEKAIYLRSDFKVVV